MESAEAETVVEGHRPCTPVTTLIVCIPAAGGDQIVERFSQLDRESIMAQVNR